MANRASHICDAFWGDDFISTEGFDAVNRRMKDCIDTCTTVISIIRQRAKHEEEFSKGLSKNFRPADCNFGSEIGGMLNALEALRLNGEKIAQEHQAASKEMFDCADRLQKFADIAKTEWKTEREKAKKIILDKQRMYEKACSAKRSYLEKSGAAEQAEIAYKFALMSSNPANVEKALKNKEKCRQDASKAEQVYRAAVNALDETRVEWERELHRYFVFCEAKEKERLKMMQNEVWIFTNIFSSTYVTADKCCEDVRLSLERILPEADIKEFVEKNQTGSRKPAAIPFEGYGNVIPNGPSYNGTRP